MHTPVEPLPRTRPDAEGIAPAAVLAFVDALERNVIGPHGFMLLRHGRVVAEGWWRPYAAGIRHALFSLSKSFTSTAVGMAVSEGLLSVDDPVISFFPDRLPDAVPENLAAMRVRHLLTMTTGHAEDATGPMVVAPDGDWVRAFLALPVDHAPGGAFLYNSAATYMCSAIVHALTGQTLTDYLTPRLFHPLGIADPVWDACPRGIPVGGWGLNLTTEDIARFGLCCLRGGRWNDRQVIPPDWLAQATARQVPTGDGEDGDWAQGYGFQFWRCRHNAYRGDGAFGQFCVVMPEQDMVLAMTGGHENLQGALDAAWDHLLPGLGAEGTPADDEALRRRLEGLSLPAPDGAATTATAERVDGRTYRLEANDGVHRAVCFAFSNGAGEMTLLGEGGDQRIAGGHADWVAGIAPGSAGLARLGAPPVGRTAARGAWTDAHTYTMTVCYVETPFVETIACRFSGDGVTVERTMNAGFVPAAPTVLVGRAG